MTHLIAGYDIGGTKARLALFERSSSHISPTPIASSSRSIRQDTSSAAILSTCYEMLLDMLEDHEHLDISMVSSAGFAIAAQLDANQKRILNAPNLGWKNLDLAPLLTTHFGDSIHTTIANDLNALLIGEIAKNHPNLKHALMVSIGSGVGGAILSNGHLMLGARGQAAEIGHVKVADHTTGKPCGCGERGCLEAYAGGVHLEQAVHDLITHTQPSWKDLVLHQDASNTSLDGVTIDLHAADKISPEYPELLQIFEVASSHLARAIASACTMLNPEALLLGGGVWNHCVNFQKLLRHKLAPQVLFVAREHLDIVEFSPSNHIAPLGAAILSMDTHHS